MKGKGLSFEFCDVCNLNHDQGRRHKYFPSHCRALTNALSRFLKKISEFQFFIQNPILLRPEHAALNCIWCVFCALSVSEIGGSFVCGNAIRHLASEEHFSSLKRFLWKHGKGTYQVDDFRVSEENFLKWENGCKALDVVASSSCEGPVGAVLGPCKDIQIQHELNSNNMDSFDNLSISSFSSNNSHSVLPLQRFTSENHSVCPSTSNGCATAPHLAQCSLPLPSCMQGSASFDHMSGLKSIANHLTGNNCYFFVVVSFQSYTCLIKGVAKSDAHCNGVDFKEREPVDNTVYDCRSDHRPCSGALQMLTQFALASKGSLANVHTGGLPPWLDMSDEHEKNLVDFGAPENNHTPIVPKGKSKKLNPHRVGAAWAEKRRIELEMEKTGKIVMDAVDANWLPNFGRVWQAGTRKESRKEFEMENHKSFKDEFHSEASLKLQPYTSKRMRMSSSDKS